jgi:threonine dehydrogenase-like Zn-dependent dehydrogenase
MGFSQDGGYGPFEVVHESNFFVLPDHVSSVEGTLLLDVIGTSGHALRRARLLRHDVESVYIAGAGPIGLGLLVVARLALGSEVPVRISDLSPWRRDYAARLGGIPVDASNEAELAALPSCDLAFDSTGKRSARQAAIGQLSRRGILVCVGHGETVTLDVSADLITPERAVLGSEYFQFSEMTENLALFLAHREALRAVITHTFPIDQISEAFTAFLGGRTGKVVVTQDLA